MSLKQNKRGINAVGFSAIGVLVVLVLFMSWYVYNGITQTALDKAQIKADADAKAKTEAGQEAPVTIKDTLVSGSLRTIDRTKDVESQVSTTAYLWDKVKKNVMLLNGASTSATAGTDTTVKNLIGGHTAEYVAFGNATYYGGKLIDGKLQIQSEPVTQQGQVFESDVYSIITTPLKITIDEAGSETILQTGDGCATSLVNMSLVGSQTDEFENLKVTVNATQKNFYLDSVIIDTPANTNIQLIEVPAMVLNSEKVSFLGDSQNYRFTPKDGAVFLKAYESFSTGVIRFTAKGTDPTTEDVDIYFTDRQKYKAIGGSDAGEIAEGPENDKTTQEDIGHNYIDGCTQVSIN